MWCDSALLNLLKKYWENIFNPLVTGVHKKVTPVGLFQYVWPFSGHRHYRVNYWLRKVNIDTIN